MHNNTSSDNFNQLDTVTQGEKPHNIRTCDTSILQYGTSSDDRLNSNKYQLFCKQSRFHVI